MEASTRSPAALLAADELEAADALLLLAADELDDAAALLELAALLEADEAADELAGAEELAEDFGAAVGGAAVGAAVGAAQPANNARTITSIVTNASFFIGFSSLQCEKVAVSDGGVICR